MLLQLYFAIFATASAANTDCDEGYYTEGKMCKPCPPKCTSCSSSDTCNQCNDSSFLSKSTCSLCPSGCKSCNSSDLCLKCKHGFHGQVCVERCSDGCSDNICDKDTGKCSCKTGYFGYSCTDKCPDTCEACHSHSDCTVCTPGYYGATCTLRCPSGCLDRTCNKTNGTCNKCIDHFSGFKCDLCLPERYGTLCENECPVNCAACISLEYCIVCNVGFYGSLCMSHCPDGCLLDSCDSSTGKCTFGCKPNCTGSKCEFCKPKITDVGANCAGKYEKNCSKSCPVNCQNKLCNQKGQCFSCINGYFGELCTHQCSSNCLNGSCDKNGACYSCIDGYYGNGCFLKCPDKCKRCLNEYCRTCNGDDMKPMCQVNCTNCKLNQSCDFVTGQCDLCKDGFYGRFCNATCDKQCSSCSSSGGICMTCSIGWYGIHTDNKTYLCDKRCHENCLNRSCDALYGSCNLGCYNGYWGQYCENKCSYACRDRACNRDNGTCSDACMDGFYGHFCENKEKGFSLTFLGLSITIVVILTAVLPACVIVAVKARQHKHATSGGETVVNDGIEIIQQEYEDLIRNQGPVYINLQIAAQEENQTTHVYEELRTTTA